MGKHAKAYIALIFICIVWGTTYLAIKIGVRHFPTFLFAGIRQAVAGLILIPVALFVNKQKDLSVKNILRQMLVGFLMLTLGNGLVSLGLRNIPSGISALICSTMPVFAVLFNLASSKKDHFNLTIGVGLLLGTCGVALIFLHDIKASTTPQFITGFVLTLAATCSWAFGSMENKRNSGQVNPLLNSGLQLLSGGIFMLCISPFADDYAQLHWDRDIVLSLLYLIVFGSALAYAAYMYTLSVLPVGIATIYAYINPLIAVLMGAMFMGEALNIYTGMAFITIVVSVFLMNMGYRKQHIEEQRMAALTPQGAFPESIPIE